MSGGTTMTIRIGVTQYTEDGDFAPSLERKATWRLKTRAGLVYTPVDEDEVKARAEDMARELVEELELRREQGSLQEICASLIREMSNALGMKHDG